MIVFPDSVCKGFDASVLPKRRPGRLSSSPWKSKWKVVNWPNRSAPPRPAPALDRPPRPAPTRLASPGPAAPCPTLSAPPVGCPGFGFDRCFSDTHWMSMLLRDLNYGGALPFQPQQHWGSQVVADRPLKNIAIFTCIALMGFVLCRHVQGRRVL